MRISIEVPERGRPDTTVTKSLCTPPASAAAAGSQAKPLAWSAFETGAHRLLDRALRTAACACRAWGERPAREDRALIPRDIRDRLRYIEIASDRLTLERFPDFLIVGPQRTGTTWLHAVLGSHPEVFLSDPKELFFFSRLKERNSPRFESAELDWYLSFFHDPLPRRLARHLRCLRRHGRLYRPKVRGEATASYAAMDRDLVEEIAVLRPDVRSLFMLRDPVERAWSHAKKDLARNRGRKVHEVPDAEWTAFFRDPYQLRCARYRENLATWRAVFGDANVFVGTFEEVEERPAALLTRVTRFLGVSDDAGFVDPSLLRKAVNPTANSSIPGHLRRILEEMLAREIEDWRRLTAAAETDQSTQENRG